MSVFVLKIIAVITMIIDHSATVLWYASYDLGIPYEVIDWMHTIGRMAFPIYAFLVVNGCEHTRSKPKYMRNMLIFGVISQIPFNLALMHNQINLHLIQFDIYISYLNVFFTFLVAMYIIFCYEKLLDIGKRREVKTLLHVLYVIPLLVYRWLQLNWFYFDVDYSWMGIVLILLLFIVRHWRWAQCVTIALWGVCLYNDLQWDETIFYIHGWKQILFVALAALCCYFYNGQKGKSWKYGFYAVYPAHLAVLSVFAMMIKW